jgi:hypothetical protein
LRMAIQMTQMSQSNDRDDDTYNDNDRSRRARYQPRYDDMDNDASLPDTQEYEIEIPESPRVARRLDFDDEKEAPVAYEYNDNYFEDEQEPPLARRLDFDEDQEESVEVDEVLIDEMVEYLNNTVTGDLDQSEIDNDETLNRYLDEYLDSILEVLYEIIDGEQETMAEEENDMPNIMALVNNPNLSISEKKTTLEFVRDEAKERVLANRPNRNAEHSQPITENAFQRVDDDQPVSEFYINPLSLAQPHMLAEINVNSTVYDAIEIEDIVIRAKLEDDSKNIVIAFNGQNYFANIDDLERLSLDAKYYGCYENNPEGYMARRVDGVVTTNINRNIELYDIKKAGLPLDIILDYGCVRNIIDNYNSNNRAFSIVKTTLTVPSRVSYDIADRNGSWVGGHHCQTGATDVYTIVPAILVDRQEEVQAQQNGGSIRQRGGAPIFTDNQIDIIAAHIALTIKNDFTPNGLNGLRALSQERALRKLRNEWVEDAFVNEGDDDAVPINLFQGLDVDAQIPIIERALPIAFNKLLEYVRGNTAELDNLQRYRESGDEPTNTVSEEAGVSRDPFEDVNEAQHYEVEVSDDEGILIIEDNKTVLDPIMIEDVTIENYLEDDDKNIILEFDGHYYATNKDIIREKAGDAKYYACFEDSGKLGRKVEGTTQTNIDRETILYDIKKVTGLMINGFVEFAAISQLLDDDISRGFTLVKTKKTIPSAVSFDIANRGGSWVGGHHCTTGPANVYTLIPAEIGNVARGGAKRLLSIPKKNNKYITKNQLAKYYNIHL